MKKISSPSLMLPEAKYKSIISVLSEGVVIMTAEGIQESNASADQILGLGEHGQDGCVADHPDVRLYNEDGSPLALEKHPCFVALATGQTFKNVVIGFNFPGDPITWISLNALPIWNGESELPDTVVASLRIVTEEIAARKALEEAKDAAEARSRHLESERARLEEMLNELNKEREIREAFVSMLTHDLRTPLTSAMFGAQRLLRSDEDTVRRSAERILGNVNRLDRMIRDLLDANRLKAGHGLPVHIAKVDLSKLILDSVESLTAIYGENIDLKIADNISMEVCADGISRVLENLVNNAFKYGQKNSFVTVGLKKVDGGAEIRVHNYGDPIDHIENLFEPYHRECKSEAKIGWGLGLVLVKGIVDAHEGTISVQSTRDEGTTFTIRLPNVRSYEVH